jgi:putative SOS response-associated peptidase YedK
MRTCTIVTCAANPDVADVHDRMPVVLAPELWEQWLDPAEKEPGEVTGLLDPPPAGTLVRHAVPDLVNRPEVDGPELVAPVEEKEAAPGRLL